MKPIRSQEPRRAESPARVTVADAEPPPPGPLMKIAGDPSVPEDAVEFRNDRGETMDAIVNLAEEIPPLKTTVTDPTVAALFPDGTIPAPGARPWHPMDSALRDGTLLEARAADGTEFMMVYRKTSRHNGIRWEAVGFWSSHLKSGTAESGPGWLAVAGGVLHAGRGSCLTCQASSPPLTMSRLTPARNRALSTGFVVKCAPPATGWCV